MKINLHKKKWVISCSYNPNKALIATQIAVLSKNIDICTTKYDNFLFLGDFYVRLQDASSLINKPICYKNPEKPSNINLILINCPRSFQNSCLIKTGLSDLHKMVTAVMKTTLRKIASKVIRYPDYKCFAVMLSVSFYKISFHRI